MRTLSIDIETYSSVDIRKSGLYKYVQSPDFEILLFAYAYDDNPVQVVDLAQGEKIPYFTVMDLHRPEVMKTAFNAAFEYYCLSKFFETHLEQWQCTMVHAWYCGYAGGLDAIGRAMEFPEDKRKLSTGKSLIKFFCTPCARTKRNGGRTRNLPGHAPDKWKLFKEYCGQDVVTEREIKNRLAEYPVPAFEHQLWVIDQAINIGGVALDTALINGALAISAQMTEELTEKARNITGLDNPNSVAQLKQWVINNAAVEIESLNKQTVADLLSQESGTDDVQAMLRIRQEMAKTSVKKYQAMQDALCDDGRVRGLLQFYGACRTGRWAGRLVQVQNLPRNYIDSLDTARALVQKQKIDALRVIYGNVPDTLSQLIRTAFIPGDGYTFAVADFSAIEARVIAWLAGEQWVNEVFASHGKIYEATASQMFGIPFERIVKGNPEYEYRAKGKVATLALGYQGGTAALVRMHALENGLTEEELPEIVQRWRQANPRIKDLWYKVENAAVAAMQTAQPQGINGLVFTLEGDLIYGQSFLTIRLPSGRRLYYARPFLQECEDPYGRVKPTLHYYGISQASKKWTVDHTYGGRLVENIVQAIARDCLAVTLERIAARGLQVVFHVHDEVIIDAPMETTVDEICGLMAEPIPWAPGLVLKGAGFESDYYMKD